MAVDQGGAGGGSGGTRCRGCEESWRNPEDGAAPTPASYTQKVAGVTLSVLLTQGSCLALPGNSTLRKCVPDFIEVINEQTGFICILFVGAFICSFGLRSFGRRCVETPLLPQSQECLCSRSRQQQNCLSAGPSPRSSTRDLKHHYAQCGISAPLPPGLPGVGGPHSVFPGPGAPAAPGNWLELPILRTHCAQA